jgi:hypothetical protein
LDLIILPAVAPATLLSRRAEALPRSRLAPERFSDDPNALLLVRKRPGSPLSINHPAVFEPNADGSLEVDAGLVGEGVAREEYRRRGGVEVRGLVAFETDACEEGRDKGEESAVVRASSSG